MCYLPSDKQETKRRRSSNLLLFARAHTYTCHIFHDEGFPTAHVGFPKGKVEQAEEEEEAYEEEEEFRENEAETDVRLYAELC